MAPKHSGESREGAFFRRVWGTGAIMKTTYISVRATSLATAVVIGILAASGAMAQSAAPPAPTTSTPGLEPETPYTNKLPTASPHWGIFRGGWGAGGTRIFDGDTGKMVGQLSTSQWSDMALDPTKKAWYVSETIWTKINRGTRQDFIAVYDASTLNLITEIPMPGRLIIGAQNNNFHISDDGKTAFVYNFSPASSVNVVDLEKKKMAQVVELPGCASFVPVAGVGFSALCSDGTIATATLTGKSPVITHTAPFFKAAEDPVFDSYIYDRAKKTAVFVTYTGLVRTATLGASPVVGDAWSLQAAAGMRPGDTKPLDINWFPGGRQLTALHKKTGMLYVLMHRGEYWTQKEDGEELWVVDLAARKVVKRVPLKEKASNINITQDDKPLIFMAGDEGMVMVMDGTSYEQKHELKRAGGGVIHTFDGQ